MIVKIYRSVDFGVYWEKNDKWKEGTGERGTRSDYRSDNGD